MQISNISRELLIKNIGKEKFCSPAEAIVVANQIKDNDVVNVVVMRLDVSVKEAIDCAKQMNGTFANWKTLLEKPDVVKFLNELLPKEAISYAKEIDTRELWIIVLEKPDVVKFLNELLPKEAISYAKEIDNHLLWDTVLRQENVVKFLNE